MKHNVLLLVVKMLLKLMAYVNVMLALQKMYKMELYHVFQTHHVHKVNMKMMKVFAFVMTMDILQNSTTTFVFHMNNVELI